MPFNTLTVGAAVTPTVIETWISHYINRKNLHQKPTAHISYHVGLNLIRQFLVYASHHTVEDIQAFTSQWVPTPSWIRTENVHIPHQHIDTAIKHITAQLGPSGIEAVGGPTWWQWRPEDLDLKADWIDLRSQYNKRKAKGEPVTRCMLYVHGGAYYFGSVDEHRYQMQRHARKLQARVFAPRYRLAPQFPFPCGLLDCLAAYLYLLTIQPPETILVAGDSAGGGMVTALLVLLRDQGIPLPAGGILLSPWVDLTHSFPSLSGGNEMDYIPSHGFLHRPSRSWPPPNSDDLKILDELAEKGRTRHALPTRQHERQTGDTQQNREEAAQGFAQLTPTQSRLQESTPVPGLASNLSVEIDGKLIEIKDQIQMYATNALLSHPLVSPVLQPSLGGLPPLLIQVGGGEMLRDEQMYLAHKAAAPTQYPPSKEHLAVQGADPNAVSKWPPTDVQLQVWEDLCHVAPTLSFTRPAKYMYRSIAQFGVWALAKAQKREMDVPDEDDASVISSDSDSDSVSDVESTATTPNPEAESQPKPARRRRSRVQSSTNPASHTDHSTTTPIANSPFIHHDIQSPSLGFVGQTGDPIPGFTHHMIRQLITRHGEIFPLPPASTLPGCTMLATEIGIIKPGPVRKWLHVQEGNAKKYAREKRAMQELRVREMREAVTNGHNVDAQAAGPGNAKARTNTGFSAYTQLGERPPPSALVGRKTDERRKAASSRMKRVGKMGLKVWSGWGSRHDEEVVEMRERKRRETVGAGAADGNRAEGAVVEGQEQGNGNVNGRARSRSRSRSRRRTQSRANTQAQDTAHATATAPSLPPLTVNGYLAPPVPAEDSAPASALASAPQDELQPQTQTRRPSHPLDPTTRLPFKLAPPAIPNDDAMSTTTVTSAAGVMPMSLSAGSAAANAEANGAAVGPVVENGELMSGYEASMRPEMGRFVTARDEV